MDCPKKVENEKYPVLGLPCYISDLRPERDFSPQKKKKEYSIVGFEERRLLVVKVERGFAEGNDPTFLGEKRKN